MANHMNNSSLVPQRLTPRAFAALVLHALVFAAVYWLAFSIRTEFEISQDEWFVLLFTMPAVVVIKTIVFYWAGHCHRSWYTVSLSLIHI